MRSAVVTTIAQPHYHPGWTSLTPPGLTLAWEVGEQRSSKSPSIAFTWSGTPVLESRGPDAFSQGRMLTPCPVSPSLPYSWSCSDHMNLPNLCSELVVCASTSLGTPRGPIKREGSQLWSCIEDRGKMFLNREYVFGMGGEGTDWVALNALCNPQNLACCASHNMLQAIRDLSQSGAG